MYSQLAIIFVFLFTGIMIGARPPNRSKQHIRGCYYTNWSQYRPEPWKYWPESYEPGLCTHLFYAFVVMKEDFTLKPFEWNDEDHDGHAGMYKRVIALKQKQPDLKVLISFGGYTFSQNSAALMRRMATNVQNRRVFIDSIVNFVRRHLFDGFDFDWEYPDWGTKAAYTALIREMREAFDLDANNTARPRLLLTAAVAAGIERISGGYNGRALVSSFDFINVMTYDFHGAWEMKTGFSAPLFDRNNDRLSVSSAMTYWNKNQGFPKEKLVVGLATYGRGWTMASSSTVPEVGAPANGPSPAQAYTRENGVASYYEVCEMIEKRQFSSHYDSVQRVPYVFKENVWVGYDDVRSFIEKLDWIKENGYGGAFVWSLDMDDFLGRCGSSAGIKYPMISAIRTKLEGGEVDEPDVASPAAAATPTPKVVPATASPSSQSPLSMLSTSPSPLEQLPTSTPSGPGTSSGPFVCTESGLYPDPSSCISFLQCDEAGNVYKMTCPSGLHFSKEELVCTWPYAAGCDKTKTKVDAQ